MLRPKQMSKVSVTGSKAVMDDVIGAVHDLHLLHLSEYDGRWPEFDNGDPAAGANEASEKLVTVRSLKSILGVEPEDAGKSRIITDETIEEELERVRTEANELDDRRDEVESELRDVEEEIGSMAPFATLGIDLDLLWGYDTLAVAVGEGDADSVERALADIDAPSQVFAEDGVVAAFAYTDEGTLESALVEANFTAVEVPEESGDPGDVLGELRHRKQQLESNLETVENQIEDLRYDEAGFLLAAEEKLSIQVQKAEAPLSFATTRNAFVAEGWIPSEEVSTFESELADAVGDHVEVEELERAAYSRHGHAETTEEVHDGAAGGAGGAASGGGAAAAAGAAGAATADDADGATASGDDGAGEATASGDDGAGEATADGGAEEVRSDGGVVTMGDEDPPVVQNNSGIVEPFELLTKAVGRPNYSELDPTLILFLTFPLMFGFIIGDLGYGLIYTGLGYYAYANFESKGFKQFGLVAAAAGVSTTIFGILYGEIFGLHLVSTHFWEGLVGLESAPIHKGLQPYYAYYANAWFVVTALFGLLHLNTGYVLEFIENKALHGTKEAVLETGSWLLALNGTWLFIFSRPPSETVDGETTYLGPKPDFIYEVFNTGSGAAFELGFTGIPSPTTVATPLGTIPLMELVGTGMIGLGIALLAVGPAHELVEIHQVLAHALSYLRIAAVLLAKAGMAFAVNLLFFGAYETHGEYHYMLSHGPDYVASHHPDATILFDGMMHGGPAMLVFGIVVLLVGHLVVLLLGVTSSGIQSIRLEYFEFFGKFYEGNGTTYTPFGSDRDYTADDGS